MTARFACEDFTEVQFAFHERRKNIHRWERLYLTIDNWETTNLQQVTDFVSETCKNVKYLSLFGFVPNKALNTQIQTVSLTLNGNIHTLFINVERILDSVLFKFKLERNMKRIRVISTGTNCMASVFSDVATLDELVTLRLPNRGNYQRYFNNRCSIPQEDGIVEMQCRAEVEAYSDNLPQAKRQRI